jgi:xanthine dehydrogenase accessory factor
MGMRRSAVAMIETWRTQERRAAIARAVDAEGLGPRGHGDLLLIDAGGETAGSLLGGAADEPTLAAAGRLFADPAAGDALVGVDIASDAATAAGLACGGHVDVLVQRLDDIPGDLWDAVGAGLPTALVSRLDGRTGTLVVGGGGPPVGTLGGVALDARARAEAEALLGRPGASCVRVRVDDVELVVEGWSPVPRLVVVGVGALAEALTRQVGLLGWEATTTVGREDAMAAVEPLTVADMVVVIDHDPGVATPALAAALRLGVGYVGALGSRRTQDARRSALVAAGVASADLERLHGPTGLDLGARNPAETAVSIVAEILAVRSGRGATSLRATTARINA